jgi:uncharacterized protein
MQRLSYTEAMKTEPAPHRLDVKAQALQQAQLAGAQPLSNYERLAADMLDWSAQFSTRTGAAGGDEPWLALHLATRFPLVCQRCMGALDLPVAITREFRFVASEAIAEQEDDACEEDLLVQTRELDLANLIEDELVMALPLIPRHDICPSALPMSAVDADFEAANVKPNPFSGLSGMLNGKSKN